MSKAKLISIQLLKTHIHADVVRAKDEIIEVAENVAAFLEGEGIGKRVSGKAAKSASTDADAGKD